MKLHIKQLLATCALVIAVTAPGVVLADDTTADRDQTRDQQQVRGRDIYGSQLMTPQERTEFHEKMRAATTREERERIRKEHHEQMEKRAKERGVTLPDEPPDHPGGMGPGGGMGEGMGPGGGMGEGMGRGNHR